MCKQCVFVSIHRRATFISRTIRREDTEVTEDEAKVQASHHVLDSRQEAILPLYTPAAFISPQYRRRTGKKMKEKLSTLFWLLLCPNLNQKHHGRVVNRKKIDLKWRMTTFNQILSWLLEPVPCWPNYSNIPRWTSPNGLRGLYTTLLEFRLDPSSHHQHRYHPLVEVRMTSHVRK